MKPRFLYRAWKARLRDQRLEIALARTLITAGDSVVDAGANKGAYTYWLREATGKSGKVFAFEPQPKLARYLQNAREQFSWKNVDVRAKALSNSVGRASLHVPGGGISPGASLEASSLPGESFECEISTLDRELNGQLITFAKIDVEGHELALFRGAGRTLENSHPTLLFECEARHLTRHTVFNVFEFLKQFGYQGFLLTRAHLLPIQKFDLNVHQCQKGERFWDAPDYFNNFLFCASDEGANRLKPFLSER